MNARPRTRPSLLHGCLLALAFFTPSHCVSGPSARVLTGVHHPGSGDRGLVVQPLGGVHPQRLLGKPVRAEEGRTWWPLRHVGHVSGDEEHALYLAIDTGWLEDRTRCLHELGVLDSSALDEAEGADLLLVQTEGEHGRSFSATELCRRPRGGVLFSAEAEERGELVPGNLVYTAADPTARVPFAESEPVAHPGPVARNFLGKVVFSEGPIAWFEETEEPPASSLDITVGLEGERVGTTRLVWRPSGSYAAGLRQSLLQVLSLEVLFPAEGGVLEYELRDPDGDETLTANRLDLAGSPRDRLRAADLLRDTVLARADEFRHLELALETLVTH